MKKFFVISLGGSIVVPKANEVDKDFLIKFRKLILNYLKKKWRFIITVGGGKINKHYNEVARSIAKVRDIELDLLGIAVTKLNAELLRIIFSNYAYSKVIADPRTKIKTKKPIIIGSGWKPGCSTDKDAVLWAKNFKVKIVVNLSNIDYIYNKDPNKFSDAKPLEKLTWQEYKKIIGNKWKPRMNAPFDPIASQIAQKLGLKVVFLNGRNLENVKNFFDGKKFIGTIIQ